MTRTVSRSSRSAHPALVAGEGRQGEDGQPDARDPQQERRRFARPGLPVEQRGRQQQVRLRGDRDDGDDDREAAALQADRQLHEPEQAGEQEQVRVRRGQHVRAPARREHHRHALPEDLGGAEQDARAEAVGDPGQRARMPPADHAVAHAEHPERQGQRRHAHQPRLPQRERAGRLGAARAVQGVPQRLAVARQHRQRRGGHRGHGDEDGEPLPRRRPLTEAAHPHDQQREESQRVGGQGRGHGQRDERDGGEREARQQDGDAGEPARAAHEPSGGVQRVPPPDLGHRLGGRLEQDIGDDVNGLRGAGEDDRLHDAPPGRPASPPHPAENAAETDGYTRRASGDSRHGTEKTPDLWASVSIIRPPCPGKAKINTSVALPITQRRGMIALRFRIQVW
ncbi:hypothetical protein [Actinomadura latina]|uniref:hypothetical protein n=1 Tax=Actinomadura latina TaxID=163603 RepID=UPI0035E3C5C9